MVRAGRFALPQQLSKGFALSGMNLSHPDLDLSHPDLSHPDFSFSGFSDSLRPRDTTTRVARHAHRASNRNVTLLYV